VTRDPNAGSASFGYASCVTTFPTGNAGAHTITATYSGDATHAPSTGTAPLEVTATPNVFQTALGLFLNFARSLHLFGLNPIDATFTTSTIPLQVHPRAVAVDPTTHTVYVTTVPNGVDQSGTVLVSRAGSSF